MEMYISSLLDELKKSLLVSLNVAFSSLGDFFSLLLGFSLSVSSGLDEFFLQCGISLLLLLEVFRDDGLALASFLFSKNTGIIA